MLFARTLDAIFELMAIVGKELGLGHVVEPAGHIAIDRREQHGVAGSNALRVTVLEEGATTRSNESNLLRSDCQTFLALFSFRSVSVLTRGLDRMALFER